VGDSAGAERAAAHVAELAPGTMRQGAPWFNHGEVYLLWVQQGRLDEAEQLLAAAVLQHPTISSLRFVHAWILAHQGRFDEARHPYEALAPSHIAGLRNDGVWNQSITFLADLAVDLGDLVGAGLLYDILLPHAPRAIVSWTLTCYGAASHSLGRLAAFLGRPDDATRHFDQALALLARLTARPLLAQTQFRYAEALAAGTATGPPERIGELAARALDTAREIGMPALAASVNLLLGRQAPLPPAPAEPTGAAGRTGAASRHGLTPREIDVLGRLVTGDTNNQIAATLIMSPTTVRAHTISIYRKLEVRGRAEAVAYALRHGIV
jgi:DNA-binding CsgD family transcriptional regulator/tetratricopeptide (TPR) repeat protein